MERQHFYPPDLARYVDEHWPEGDRLWVPRSVLCEVLSVAYAASLTTEEARPTRFRLLLTPAERLPESGKPNQGVLRLMFEPSRPFSSQELRRLSPSTPFETALIGVHLEADKLRIWGIAHSGPAWLAPTWGGRSLAPNWTYDPIIHATAPGHVAVRRAGKLIAALEGGEIKHALTDVFESHWLPLLFERERERVRAEHAALQAKTASPTLVEHSLVGRVAQHLLRRTIQLVRGARHGGLLLVEDLPDTAQATAPGTALPTALSELPGLRLKYRLRQDEPSHRYRSLLLEILSDLALRSVKSSLDWNDFADDTSPRVEQLEQAVFELSRALANLDSDRRRSGARQALWSVRLRRRGFGRATVAYGSLARPRRGRQPAATGRRRERRHPPPRCIPLRAPTTYAAGNRRLPRRRREFRNEPRRTRCVLGTTGESVRGTRALAPRLSGTAAPFFEQHLPAGSATKPIQADTSVGTTHGVAGVTLDETTCLEDQAGVRRAANRARGPRPSAGWTVLIATTLRTAVHLSIEADTGVAAERIGH